MPQKSNNKKARKPTTTTNKTTNKQTSIEQKQNHSPPQSKSKQNNANKKTEKSALFLVTPVELILLQPSDKSQRRTGRKFDYDKQNISVVICHTNIP
jgi:hypothetical protein